MRSCSAQCLYPGARVPGRFPELVLLHWGLAWCQSCLSLDSGSNDTSVLCPDSRESRGTSALIQTNSPRAGHTPALIQTSFPTGSPRALVPHQGLGSRGCYCHLVVVCVNAGVETNNTT